MRVVHAGERGRAAVGARNTTRERRDKKDLQVVLRNEMSRRKTIPSFPIPSSRDDAKQLRVIEHYIRVVQFARDLLRSDQRDETAENKALTPCVSDV
jgi:hypothetical protein